jgi:hypothetical protein
VFGIETFENPRRGANAIFVGGALLEVLGEGKCSRRDKGCLGSGTGVAEVGGLTKDGGRLEVSGRRGNGRASDREEPLGLMGSGMCMREIGM